MARATSSLTPTPAGGEVARSNMPDGDIDYTTRANVDSTSIDSNDDNNAVNYYHFDAEWWMKDMAQAGVNWIAVELHAADGASNFVFDLNLTRYAIQPCTALPGSPGTCVRYPPSDTGIIWSWSDGWSYLDASLPLPLGTWRFPGFNDASWKKGPSPLGKNGWDHQTDISTGADAGNGRRTYFFRRTFSVPDAKCFIRLKLDLLAQDGAVVYINGAEAARTNMPLGIISPTTPARREGPWDTRSFELSAGFLRVGSNVVAVEVHEAVETASSGNFFFDLAIMGQRDLGGCLPLPT
eukprot:TRINITY_DN573_c1_g2_i1.p1 TRINITY_DN573_c1_g2~~TRINITY_DN573_c1_g2_i1.p1  ORF type:complete len:295 (-),score=-0.24 TRINITY_DN573_c1_g2_i1:126-1010(-)